MISGWSTLLAGCAALGCSLAPPLASQVAPGRVQPARVALILDLESSRFQPLVEAFQNEVGGFFRPDQITLLPPTAGDGTA